MPFKSFGLACIVITFVSTPADAQNVDFAKLLGTINYPEQEEADADSGAAPVESAPEIAVPEEADSEHVAPEASALQPIPRLPGAKLSEYGEIRGESVDPLLDDDPLLSDESPLPGESVLSDDLPHQTAAPAVGDEVTGEPEPRAAEDADTAPHRTAPHRTAPQLHAVEGADAATRQDPPSGRVDFSAILDDPAPSMAAAPGAYHGQFAAHPSAPPCECDKCRDALPVVPYLEHVDLPPPTTLEAYYRTPACYRGLWSGYEQQRQRECQRRHKHLPGHMRVPMH